MASRAQLGFALALALGGCRGGAAEQPMAGDLELCCKAANDDDVSFIGCRATGYCRASESVWIRGPLTCTADTPDECAGGRCCKLDLDALADRSGTPSPETPPTLPFPEAAQTVDSPPSPVDITPVPLDWQALPTVVFVPRMVCPATVERGVTGTVVLQVEIDEAGHVTEVAIREGFDPECDALARDALLHAEFEPALTPEGRPLPATLRYEYSFAADNGAP